MNIQYFSGGKSSKTRAIFLFSTLAIFTLMFVGNKVFGINYEIHPPLRFSVSGDKWRASIGSCGFYFSNNKRNLDIGWNEIVIDDLELGKLRFYKWSDLLLIPEVAPNGPKNFIFKNIGNVLTDGYWLKENDKAITSLESLYKKGEYKKVTDKTKKIIGSNPEFSTYDPRFRRLLYKAEERILLDRWNKIVKTNWKAKCKIYQRLDKHYIEHMYIDGSSVIDKQKKDELLLGIVKHVSESYIDERLKFYRELRSLDINNPEYL